jgi:hypothetical protein
MKKKLPLLFFLIASLGGHSFSQNNDAQFWENIYLEKNLTQRWAGHLNEEGRLTDNFTSPNYVYVDFGLTYKVNKHIHCTAAYVPIAKKLVTGFTSFRHQMYVDVVFKFKFHHFTIYDRQMFQNQYNDVLHSRDWDIPNYYLRNKITVKYKTKSRLTPYMAEELYYEWDNHKKNSNQIDRLRYYAGLFYRFDGINELEAYYLIEPHYHVNNSSTNWIVGLGFSHVLY